MTRLASIEKGGYYPFPSEHLPALASLFAPDTHSGKLLDPCAGEGAALHYLAEAWHLRPYANELDITRAGECQRLFGATQAVQGNLYQLRASGGGFVGLWCNPPYMYDTTGADKRRELGMLKHALHWLQTGGFALWCVYAHHITSSAAGYLAGRCDLLDLWAVPGLHLDTYQQVVLVARLGKPTIPPEQRAMELVSLAQSRAIPLLSLESTPRYEFPAPLPRKTFLFAPKFITPAIALQACKRAVHSLVLALAPCWKPHL